MHYLNHHLPFSTVYRTGLIVLTLLLTGCSVKFVYNQLDWVTPWYVDDYVTFNPAQELLLDQRLDQLLAWHRTDQLPEYAGFLEQLAVDSEDGLDELEIDATHQQVQFFANQLIDATMPSMVLLLSDINEQQYVELFEKFEQKNEGYRKKYIKLSDRKQRQKRANEIRKFVQRFTGLLDTPQIALIGQWSTAYQLMGKEFLQSRLLWQQQLKAILQQRLQVPARQQALTDLLSNHRFGHSTTFEQKAKVNQQLLQQLFFALDRSLSQQQRRQMIKGLNSYALDFRQLSSLN